MNKPIKSHMKHVSALACRQSQKEKDNSTPAKVIDLKLSILKPLGLKWLEACHYVERNGFIRDGFAEAGITDAVNAISTGTKPTL